MDLLRSIDYVTIELHYYSLTGEGQKEVIQKTNDALQSFRETHTIDTAPNYFWALKKGY
jgi:hypothetical protein